MPLDTNELKKFARLYLARKKLKEKYNELTKTLESMTPGLLDHLIDEEVDTVSLKGGAVVSIQTQIWPKYRDRGEVAKALKAAGMSDMVEENFNNQTLASYLRELIASGNELPEPLRGVLEPNPVSKLVARKYK